MILGFVMVFKDSRTCESERNVLISICLKYLLVGRFRQPSLPSPPSLAGGLLYKIRRPAYTPSARYIFEVIEAVIISQIRNRTGRELVTNLTGKP
jgi:hypothetical protein